MNRFINTLSLTVTAVGSISAYQLVGFNKRVISSVDAKVLGVAQNPAEAGDDVAVLVKGMHTVKATGVVSEGDALVSSLTGGVQKAGADPSNVFADALTSAADGELVEILIR